MFCVEDHGRLHLPATAAEVVHGLVIEAIGRAAELRRLPKSHLRANRDPSTYGQHKPGLEVGEILSSGGTRHLRRQNRYNAPRARRRESRKVSANINMPRAPTCDHNMPQELQLGPDKSWEADKQNRTNSTAMIIKRS